MTTQTLKSILMPVAMVIGAIFCRPLATLEAWTNGTLTPMLIAAMLFITFCRVDIRAMRLSTIHIWMLAVQFIGSIAVYHIVEPLMGEILAEGAMICVLAPIAMAAVVIGGMLGANVTTMVTYSLICNFATALIAPIILHSYGNGTCTFAEIIGRVAPTLLAPFVVAQLLRWIKPKAAEWFSKHSSISFYLWLVSLILVLGRTTAFIIDTEADIIIEIALALIALVLCIAQFSIGRVLGRMLGDTVAGGQSVGQKNTILAVWMSLNFLNPIASIAPTAYIIWQNFVNSYQIYRHEKGQRR
ncbi:MAG: transporter [Alistipes sp.]|nr:transporter [Alistipes sp.]